MTPLDHFADAVRYADHTGERPATILDACLRLAAHHGSVAVLTGADDAMVAMTDAVGVGLDQLADSCGSAGADDVGSVVSWLRDEWGAGGPHNGDYYDPANSLVSEVLARAQGNPITLSVVLMAVARRCGHEVHGVNMPSHFITVTAEEPPRWIDLFGGDILDFDGVRDLFTRVTLGRLGFQPDHLARATGAGIIGRQLNNLQLIYSQASRTTELATIGMLSAAVPKLRPGAAVSAAKKLTSLGRFDHAAAVLSVAADRSEGRERERLQALADQNQHRLN